MIKLLKDIQDFRDNNFFYPIMILECEMPMTNDINYKWDTSYWDCDFSSVSHAFNIYLIKLC